MLNTVVIKFKISLLRSFYMSFLSLATKISPLRGYHYICKLLISEKNVPLSPVGVTSW